MSKDIRVSLGFLDHPKTRILKRRLGAEGVVSLVRFWCFTAQNCPRGTYENHTEEYLELAADWPGEPGAFIETALSVGFLERIDGGFKVHDWEIHNPFAYHAEERSQKARESVMNRYKKKAATHGIPDVVDTATERIRNVNVAYTPSPSPSPIPSPSPTPSPPPSPNEELTCANAHVVVTTDCDDDSHAENQPEDEKSPRCPHKTIIAAYHEILPELPRVETWTPVRAKHLACRWKEAPERQNIDWWRAFFAGVRDCPFLMGQNDHGWRADLAWMLTPQKFAKIIEGGYQRARKVVSDKTARTIDNLRDVDLDAPWGFKQ